MVSLVEATRGVYEAFGRGDIASVLALLAPDIRWTEAEGGPNGGTTVGFVDGKAAAFRQYTDTWLHRQPME